MPGPGFEPGLLRPQRSVLTTRRSRLTILPTAGLQTENFVPYGATLGEISGSLQHSLVWTLQFRFPIISPVQLSQCFSTSALD